MLRYKLSDCGDRGWFIGDFAKAAFPSKDFEICYQKNPRTQTPSHIHISYVVPGLNPTSTYNTNRKTKFQYYQNKYTVIA